MSHLRLAHVLAASTIPVLLGTSALFAQVKPAPQAKPSQGPPPLIHDQWPALPRTGFLRGRAATQADVDSGNAVFVVQDRGQVIGQPLSLLIPQYALWKDHKSGQVRRVIVIQAESARGHDMIGFREIATGSEGVGLLTEFTLLGEHPPKDHD